MFLAAPTTTAPRVTLEALTREAQHAVQGILTLDPQTAVLRAGLSLLILAVAAFLIAAIRIALRSAIDRVTPQDGEQHKRKRHRVGGMAMGLIRVAVLFGALYFVLRVWGVDIDAFSNGAIGSVIGNIYRALLILVLATAAIEISGFAIIAVFGRLARKAVDPRRAAQVRTLAPVLKGAVQTIIIVLAAMMFLSQIGVEVGPLVAGAGIVGLAVGFGAQSIVKDFLTGIFLIIEDIVSIGDVVQIADSTGTVEDMTLRTIRLRDYDGTLHVFPYGEAQVIHNKTKIYAYFAFEIQISYFSDADKAIEITREVGDKMRADEAYNPFMLGPVEIGGIAQLGDNGVVLKGRIKTQAGQNVKVGREYYRRIKRAMDEAGVILSHRHNPAPPFDAIEDRAKV